MPWIVVVGALVKASVSLAILFIFIVLLHGFPPWTAIFLPLVLAPIALLTLAISWFLASTGVFIRDLSQIVSPLVTLFEPVKRMKKPSNSMTISQMHGWE